MKLSRDLSLFSVTMIGVGAMIGAGIFVLTGIASGVAGPAILIAFLLNGLVALFTASAYAELGGSIPEAGGGYLWVKQSLPQPTGFLSGWMSWMAHSVACSLYAVGFGAYFGEVLLQLEIHPFLPPEPMKKVLAVMIVILFSYINYRGAKETGRAGNIVTILKVLILFVFAFIGLRLIFQEPGRFQHFSPFFVKGFHGIATAMGLTYVAFEGYEIIAQSGEEIKDPEKNIPRAIFLSLLIVVPIYILIAFVALGVVNPGGMTAWDFLGAQKETALVGAARDISQWAGVILVIGGLFSTVSALNATIYSSSRVSFAMGRDYNLPRIFSNVHSRFKTPSGSIFVSSCLVIVMLVSLPIEDIASSADIMFLFLFIFVNVALIHIRRKSPTMLKGYKSPFFPLFPVLGILTQVILVIVMFFYSPKSFIISLVWIGVGFSIYYSYSRLKEKKEVGPEVVLAEKQLSRKDFRLVIGIEEEKELLPLMNLAISMAKEKDAEISLTHVISLPPQTPLTVGRHFMGSKKMFLETASRIGEKNKIPVSFDVRVSHRIYQGILDSVRENKADLLLLGSGKVKLRGKILGSVLDPLLQEAPCDAGVARIESKNRIKKVLVPTAGGPNAKVAIEWGGWIVSQNKGKMTLLFIIRDEAGRTRAEEVLEAAKKDFPYEKKMLDHKIILSRNTLKTLSEESSGYDLTLIGASREGLWKRIRFGTIPEKLLRTCPVSVLVVRKYEGAVLSWLRRFIAG